MKQQTAVEWLESKVLELDNENFTVPYRLLEAINQAKEMEKQQIIEAHGVQKNYKHSQIDPEIITGEQYYNKKFNL